MENRAAPISLAGSHLGDTRHVCAFFSSDDEAIHVVNADQRDDHRRRVAAAGIDTAAAEEHGQLELRTSTDTYLRDGRFVPALRERRAQQGIHRAARG